MKTDKVVSFGSHDKVLQDKLKRKLLRKEAAKQQVSKACSSEPSTLFSGSMRILNVGGFFQVLLLSIGTLKFSASQQ